MKATSNGLLTLATSTRLTESRIRLVQWMVAALTALICWCSVSVQAQSQVIYRETFGRPDTSTGNITPTNFFWQPFESNGVVFTGNSQISSDGTGKPINLANVNAGPNLDGTFGPYAEGWHYMDGARRLTYTPEFSFQLSDYVPSSLTFSWYQGTANTNWGLHLILRLDNTWYMSVAGLTNAIPVGSGANFGNPEGGGTSGAQLVSMVFDPAAANWRQLFFDGYYNHVTGVRSNSTMAGLVVSNLPPPANLDGTVTAFGLMRLADNNGNGGGSIGNSRFDTFQIEGDTNISIPKAVLWKGATDAIWDLTTTNWQSGGDLTNYNQRDLVTFDDTLSANSTVNIAIAANVGSLVISNNAVNYTFIGSGRVVGNQGLVKRGTGTLTLAHTGANTYSAPTIIEDGTLQIGNADATGNLPSGALVTNSASLVYNRSDTVSIAQQIYGTGSVVKNGGNIMSLSGVSGFTGPFTVNGGTLLLNGTFNGGNTLSNASGSVLGGTGGNTGPVNVSGTLAPGVSPGTFTSGNLTLFPGATIAHEVAGTNTIGGGVNDLLQVNGDLTLNNNVITIVPLVSTLLTNQPYRLINYTGAKSGSFGTPNFSGVRYAVTLDESVTNQINATFTGSGPTELLWISSASSVWDLITTANFSNLTTTVSPDVFYNFDTVTFNDTAAQKEVAITGTLQPTRVIVDTAAGYTLGGSGRLTGAMNLRKLGAGTLFFDETGVNNFSGGVSVSNGTAIFGQSNAITGGIIIASNTIVQVGTNSGSGTLPGGNSILDGQLIFNVGGDVTANNLFAGTIAGSILKTNAGILTLGGASTFTGAVYVANGTLRTSNGSALGRTNVGTVIADGATLDVFGVSLGFEPVTVQGVGVGGAGAIVNNSAAGQNNALRWVTLLADTTFGGASRWDIREATSGVGNAILTGGGFVLRKISTNQVSLVGVQASTLGNIIVEGGLFGIETGTTLGTSANSITVSNGAGLTFFNNSVILDRTITLNGDGTGFPSASINSGSVNISQPVTANGTVVFSGGGTSMNLNGGLTGTANVIKIGSSRLAINGAASYVGSTVVSNGTIIFDGGKTGGTGITIHTNGVLGGGGASAVTENVTVNNGGVSPGNPSNLAQEVLTINGNVTLNSSSNLFELSPNTGAGNDLLTVFGDLTLTGSNTFRISVTDHLTVGDVYTLVTYFGTGNNITTNSVGIIPPTFGYEFALVDPQTTPGEIRIQVLLAIGFDIWLGNNLVNPTRWDNGVTTNWLKAGVNSVFTNGDFAHFSDFVPGFVASSTNITLFEQLTTAGVIFSNSSSAPFSFVGPGGLSGGGLVLEGEAPVLLNNSGTNLGTGGGLIDFNAAVFFNTATLIVGNGGTNGNLAGGGLTNRGKLVINRSGSLEISNAISGTGSITNLGSGTVTFSGSSTHSGVVTVLGGTVRAGAPTANGGLNSAFGSTNGVTIFTNGTTFDINGQNNGPERFIFSGAGVGSQGVIVNNSTNAQTSALQAVVLAGNTTWGGTARWDIRGGLAQLHTLPTNSNYKITKVGTNQISLVAITDIDSNLGDLDIMGGSFAIQTATRQFGNPTNTITVFSNANLNTWNLTDAPLNKRVVINEGGGWWLENGTVTNIGLVTLNGSNTFNMQGTRLTLRSNGLAGAGSLYKIGNGTLELASTNTFVGNTTISNGTIALIDNIELNSTLITMGNSNTAAIDVSGRVDGTLTIITGRTLKGQGTVRGSLTINSGGTLDVGNPLGGLIVTNAVALNGATLMDIDGTTGTGDHITNAASITYGGTLTVSNIGGTPVGGQTYKLFSAAVLSGTFSSVTLPPLGGSDYWTNNLAVDGSITVISTVKPQPLITSVEIIGGNLVIRGTNNNGTAPGNVLILCSSNLLLPLSNWTVLSTNAWDGNGNLDYTNGVAGEPQQFYILQAP